MALASRFLPLLLLVACAAGAAGHDDAAYAWRDNGRALSMQDHGSGTGVEVTQASPAPLFGLQAGDLIVAVDAQPVRSLGALMAALERHRGTIATLQVQRNGKQRLLRWGVAELRTLLPTPPPAPPAPPRH
jgi:S1-C subfamily serine protease